MANIVFKDLEESVELDNQQLSHVHGGWYYNLYQPTYSYYFNPFAYSLQSSWASRGMSFDAGHNSFIDYLRS